jgi:hypothetical protein
VCALLFASIASAQTNDRAVVLQNAPILLVPDPARQPLRVAAVGTILTAFEEKDGWLRVEFRDPQFGVRGGYIETRFVRIERAALQPLDLSVPQPAPTERPLETLKATPPLPQAEPAVSNDRLPPNRVFIDVNYMSLHPLQQEQAFTFSRLLFGETATAAAAYPELASVDGLDIGGAVMLGSQVGFGVRALWAEWSGPVGLAIRIPHPTLNARFGTDADISDLPVLREEQIFDFFALYSENRPDWRVQFFGGPSYFRLTHDMVSVINYTQFASPITGVNTVNITTQQMATVEDWTLGFNAGADASWFFSRYVGVGGGLRFNFGTLKIDEEPLSGEPGEFRVGSTTFVGGARFRF